MQRLGGFGLLFSRCRAQRLAEMRKIDSDGRAGKTSGLERRERRNLVRVRVFGVLLVLLLLRLRVEVRYWSLGYGLGRRRDWLCVVDGEGSEVLVASSRHNPTATLDLRLLHAWGAVHAVELVVETWEMQVRQDLD
jgi:hypothetical protein